MWSERPDGSGRDPASSPGDAARAARAGDCLGAQPTGWATASPHRAVSGNCG